MSQKKKTCEVALYEPRTIFRNIVKNYFEDSGFSVSCVTRNTLAEYACHSERERFMMATGIAGSGSEIGDVLRLINHFSCHGYDIIVWLPQEEVLLQRMLYAMGVRHVLIEDRLLDDLKAICIGKFPEKALTENPIRYKLHARLSACEIRVILDYSSGLNSHNISSYRHTSYKTVLAHKFNASQKLGLESKEQWFKLLASIETIRAYYK